MTTPKPKGGAAGGAGKARSMMVGGLLGAAKTTAAWKPPFTLAGRLIRAFAATAMCLAAWTGTLRASTIYVPNGSFESPVTSFVDTRIDSWQKTPKPFWYDESGGFLWTQLTGVFANTAAGSADHIDNIDGSQAVYVFAVPEVGLIQDYDSIGGTSSAPEHAFNAVFQAGKAYSLSVGLIAAGGGMTNGASLELSLYYRDAASNQVAVAATSVTNTSNVFSNQIHLLDFQVNAPFVKASDPWVGQHIGIAIMSTVDFGMAGGYWDLDNVRLTETRAPILTGAAATNGYFGFSVESEPGLKFEILASTDVTLPVTKWTSLGTLTNDTGSTFFGEPATSSLRRFYQARQLP